MNFGETREDGGLVMAAKRREGASWVPSDYLQRRRASKRRRRRRRAGSRSRSPAATPPPLGHDPRVQKISDDHVVHVRGRWESEVNCDHCKATCSPSTNNELLAMNKMDRSQEYLAATISKYQVQSNLIEWLVKRERTTTHTKKGLVKNDLWWLQNEALLPLVV